MLDNRVIDQQEHMDKIVQQCMISRVWFVENVLGVEHIETWQRETLEALDRGETRISIRSGHGVGKTAFVAWCALHYILFRNNVKIPVTSPSSSQLKDGLIPEIALWAGKLPPFLRNELSILSERVEKISDPKNNFISFRTARADQPEALAGVHAQFVMVLVDEASGVPEIVYQTAQGTLSTKGAIVILIGNPTKSSGYFYRTQTRMKKRWWAKKVSCYDSTRVSKDYIEEVMDTYGINSNQFRIRVLGEFPGSEDDTVIPREYAESALGRDIVEELSEVDIVWGIDPGRGGDPTGFCARSPHIVFDLELWSDADTMIIVGRVKRKWDETPTHLRPKRIYVDSIGIGGPVADRLRELDNFCDQVIDVNVAEAAPTSSRYHKLRDEMWYNMRAFYEAKNVRIEPSLKYAETLVEELVIPLDIPMSSGKLRVEPKEEMKRRGFPSPNLADALGVTLCYDGAVQSGRSGGRTNWNKTLDYSPPHVV